MLINSSLRSDSEVYMLNEKQEKTIDNLIQKEDEIDMELLENSRFLTNEKQLIDQVMENEAHDCFELRNLSPSYISCSSKFELAQFFLFMIWDGMAFFSVRGYHKLKRMKKPGRKQRCYDRYKTPDSVVMGFLYLVAATLVIIFEASKYGTIHHTKIDLMQEGGYSYNLN